MEVTMDTNPSLSLPPQPYPPSPHTQPSSESRKRSIHDLADASHQGDGRPSPRYTTETENQENTAPAVTPGDADAPEPLAASMVSKPTNPNTDTDTPMADPASKETTATLAESTLNTVPVGAAGPAAKKRKLSPASREAKQQEKEAKEKARLEERAKKEEERRAKEEERKKREAEREEEKKKREEKRKAREEEKAAKEEEKRKKEAAKEEERRKKEEERLKKERAQPKLNAFFAKPKVPGQPSSAGVNASPKKIAEGASGQSLQEAKAVSDYEREFPEFFLQSHTRVAPPHRFERDAEALRHMRDKLDAFLRSADAQGEAPSFRPSELFKLMPYKRRRGQLPASVKEILLRMQNLSDQGTSDAVQKQQKLLRDVTMKSLKFGEDVRPPYQGTYTRRLPASSAHKMMRNPFHRGLPETNYDYDSEAEWEEPEEGEDLDSEEEEEGSEDGEDDMDGFLDDDDDQLAGKRGPIVGDLEPICTGIRWQEHRVDPELSVYKIETISDAVTFPIDPFSTVYWQKPKAADPVQAASAGRGPLDTFMGTPTSAGASTQDGAALAVVVPTKAKRTFPPDQLEEFKQVVNGSDLTKTGLIEILKKRFPKVSKEVLKDTLNSLATRVGQKEVEKKWVCK